MGDVSVTTPGGITFHLIFDAAADAAPQTFRDGVEQAARLLSQAIANPITVNIKIGYSGTKDPPGAVTSAPNGAFESYEPISATEVLSILGATAGSFAPGVGTVIGGLLGGLLGSLLPSSVLPSNFNQNIRQDLIASSSSNLADSLPTGTNSIQGWPLVWVSNAQLKLFGLSGANDTTTDDASITFNTNIPSEGLVGVALHELAHALGRQPKGPEPNIFDLFRFTSPGQRLFDGGDKTAPASYFSLDGGVTKLADYGTTADPSDFFNNNARQACKAAPMHSMKPWSTNSSRLSISNSSRRSGSMCAALLRRTCNSISPGTPASTRRLRRSRQTSRLSPSISRAVSSIP